MKNIFPALFIAFVAASFFYLKQRNKVESPVVAAQASTSAADPTAEVSTPHQPRQIIIPEPQTTLLSDTVMEGDLLESLTSEKTIQEVARVESVNCEKARCQVLVEPLSPDVAPQSVFFTHLEAHPEFGRSLLISPNSDKENKRLLTFLYSQETQVSTTH